MSLIDFHHRKWLIKEELQSHQRKYIQWLRPTLGEEVGLDIYTEFFIDNNMRRIDFANQKSTFIYVVNIAYINFVFIKNTVNIIEPLHKRVFWNLFHSCSINTSPNSWCQGGMTPKKVRDPIFAKMGEIYPFKPVVLNRRRLISSAISRTCGNPVHSQ